MRSAFAVLFFVFLCHTPAAAEKKRIDPPINRAKMNSDT